MADVLDLSSSSSVAGHEVSLINNMFWTWNILVSA
jgi:hypothetical protein